MVSDTELRRWRKFRSQSRRRLRPSGIFSLIVTVFLLVIAYLSRTRPFAWGWWAAVLGLVWIGSIGDWINVRYLNRRIAEAEREREPS